eukprot:TRINITY_DN6570_c0_g1_i3.p1 TRINITY_DN6570_c0_g1~~TRINITY_DN6570_c0_g1_i3.p1  ORF type:complete len:1605 (-),score=364.92 TRINITY_DN6570_c0_g1_i3:641-5077(-)
MGVPGMFAFHPQDAFVTRPAQGYVNYSVSPASGYLRSGKNYLTVQAHNFGIAKRLFVSFNMSLGTENFVVINSTKCEVFLGVLEPSGYYFDPTPVPIDIWDINPPDWVELYNNDTNPVDLSDWSITDDPDIPRKWVFPTGTSIGADSYYTVFTDEYNFTGTYHHTNFNLDWTGGELYLYDDQVRLKSKLKYPQQSPFHSYIRNSTGQYVYSTAMTPERANVGGTIFYGVTPAPVFNVTGAFYDSEVVLNISAVQGASIYYTFDGSRPSSKSSVLYTSPLKISINSVVRAMAVLPNYIESVTITNTYLINEKDMKNYTALVITGDPRKTFYKPEGFMAISGGNYTPSWVQSSPTAFYEYNSVFIKNGEGLEKEGNMAIYSDTPENSLPSIDIGVSMSSSPASVPRFRLTYDRDLDNPNRYNCCYWDYKPSMNAYFRSQYGSNHIRGDVIPESHTLYHKDFRIRAGKNDPVNPFIMDEFARRLYFDITGGRGAVGMVAALWVNAGLKGIYNVAQKVSQTWLSQTFAIPKSADLDLLKVLVWVRGDGQFMTSMRTYLRTSNWMTNVTGWDYVRNNLIDVEAFVDYLIVNTWCGTWDWPHNNFYTIRARVPGKHGRFRMYMWDAEGCFRADRLTYNTFQTDLIKPTLLDDNYQYNIPHIFTLMYNSSEFKMIWADRTQKAFYNGGALTPSNVARRWYGLVNVYQPLLNYMWNITLDQSRFDMFFPARNATWFNQLKLYGFWPDTRAPLLAPYGSIAQTGTISVTLTNPNAAGTIYYTLNGSDPRGFRGVISSSAIKLTGTKITISSSSLLCARVYNGSEWSPIECASYTILDSYSIAITEIHYNPAEGKDYEFIELKNVGNEAMDMTGLSIFIDKKPAYTFRDRTVILPGKFYVLVGDVDSFMASTGGKEPDFFLNTSMSNSGGSVAIVHPSTNTTVLNVTYDTSYPWTKVPDGLGFTLVPVNPNPDIKSSSYLVASSWRASSGRYGSPYADDPTPVSFPNILVNELQVVTSPSNATRVELYNPTSSVVDISHWWLTDSFTNPYKFMIPAGTTIPAGGYITIDVDITVLTINPAGDDIYLFSGNEMIVVTGYYHGFKFPLLSSLSDENVISRYIGGCGAEYFSPSNSSMSSPNTPPFTPSIGGLVISSFSIGSTNQYIELTSLSPTTINLANIQIQSDSKSIFKFSTQSIAPFGKILVTSADPTTFNTIPNYGWTVVGPFTQLIKVNSPALISVANSLKVFDYIHVSPDTWKDTCFKKLDFWSVSNDPCLWVKCSDWNQNFISTASINLIADSNDNGRADAGDQPIVNANLCVSTSLSGVSRFCETTDSTGTVNLNTVENAGLKLHDTFYLRFNLGDSALTSLIPFPYPAINPTGVVTPDFTYLYVSWTPSPADSLSKFFLIRNAPYIIEGYISYGNAYIANVVVKVSEHGVVLGSVTTDSNGKFIFQEGDTISASYTPNTPKQLSVSFDQITFQVEKPGSM